MMVGPDVVIDLADSEGLEIRQWRTTLIQDADVEEHHLALGEKLGAAPSPAQRP